MWIRKYPSFPVECSCGALPETIHDCPKPYPVRVHCRKCDTWSGGIDIEDAAKQWNYVGRNLLNVREKP